MLTRKSFIKLLILFMALSLVIVACDRPLPSADNANENVPTNDNDNGYPGTVEDPAVGGNTSTDPETPGEAEVPAETSEEAVPAETGEEAVPPETSEEGVPAEEPSAAPSESTEEGSDEVSEAEVPAETSEGVAEGEPSEAEVPAEGDVEPATTEEGEAETSETETSPEPSSAEVPAAAVEETAVVTQIPATHTVVAGENLYRIGLKYGISWVAIAQLNGITNPDQIYVGQVLKLPGGQPPPMPTPEGINYVVKRGDTLYRIGLQFNISWVEIAEANGLVNPNEIYAGQILKIPVNAPTPPPVVYHVVQPGETLFRISLRYGLPWLAIANANNIRPPYYIYSGQTLVIPGGQS